MSEENNETSKEETNEVSETPKTTKENKQKSNGKWLLTIIILLIAVVAVLFKFGIFDRGNGDENPSQDSEQVVATVIDTTITRADLDEKIQQVKRSLPEGAVDPTEDAAFELQLLNDLIDLEILTAAAMEKNYTVTQDEIDAEMAIIIEQFPNEEEFNNQLAVVGITREELEDNIETEMHIKQLLDEETDIESIVVTDEEIEALYNMSVGDAENVPSLEEVEDVIRAQIKNQKSGEMIEAYVAELRENANIEINI